LLYLEQPVTFTLTDAKGSKALTEQMMQRDCVELNTSALSAGFYHFHLEDPSGKIMSGKLVKE
jgi:hypothetical protein